MKDTLAILTTLLFAALGSPSPGAEPFSGISGDKTLVVWASPANLTQRGGSALTIDDRKSHFDAIVFGEIAPSRWMAGSDFYRRTMREQDAVPAETVGADTVVQIAIVYRGNEVTLYRNGQPYSQHEIQEPQRFDSDSAVVIGLRHLESEDGACFAGAIDDARIYNVALTAQQIGQLSPNQPSEPKPIAWWNFENGKPEDVLGAFPAGKLVGKARIESGKLVLDGVDSYLVTPPTVTAKPRVCHQPRCIGRTGAQLPSHASRWGEFAGRSQCRFLSRWRLSSALHPGASLAEQAFLQLRPRHQPRHAALDLADDETAARLHRSRHVQRHRFLDERRQTGRDLSRTGIGP